MCQDHIPSSEDKSYTDMAEDDMADAKYFGRDVDNDGKRNEARDDREESFLEVEKMEGKVLRSRQITIISIEFFTRHSYSCFV